MKANESYKQLLLRVTLTLLFTGVPLIAQEKTPKPSCRPIGPEDTVSTPLEIRALPYCFPTEPVKCEEALFYLDDLSERVQKSKDPYLIIIARLGKGEKSERLSWTRLNAVKARLSDYLPSTEIVTAVGSRIRGHGKLEFYGGGKLLNVLPYPRNTNVDCSGLG